MIKKSKCDYKLILLSSPFHINFHKVKDAKLNSLQQQLDDVMRNKNDLEDRMLKTSREKADLSSQLEDNEEEMSEVMKKYKASVSQLSVDQITIQEQSNRVTDLEEEKNQLKSQVSELTVKITSLEGENLANPAQSRLELKVRYSICICSLVFQQRNLYYLQNSF